MAHYIQMADGRSIGVWLVEDTGSRRIDVTSVSLPNAGGGDMVALLHATYPGSVFLK